MAMTQFTETEISALIEIVREDSKEVMTVHTNHDQHDDFLDCAEQRERCINAAFNDSLAVLRCEVKYNQCIKGIAP